MVSRGIVWAGEVSVSLGLRRPWRTRAEKTLVESYDNPGHWYPKEPKRPLVGWTWMAYGSREDMHLRGFTFFGLWGQVFTHTYRKQRI